MQKDGQHHAPAALLPAKYPDTNVTKLGRLERTSGWFGKKKKNLLPLLALEPRTVQPGASHCGLVWTERDTSTQFHIMPTLKKISTMFPKDIHYLLISKRDPLCRWREAGRLVIVFEIMLEALNN
jgi:hypothetical protein